MTTGARGETRNREERGKEKENNHQEKWMMKRSEAAGIGLDERRREAT